MNELQELIRELDVIKRTLSINGEAYAQAEYNYKVALGKKILELRADGMPATLINNVVYGLDGVAELRLNRDIALTTYETNKESLNVQKLKIRILENQLDREYRG